MRIEAAAWKADVVARLVTVDQLEELAVWCDGWVEPGYQPRDWRWPQPDATLFELAVHAETMAVVEDLKRDVHRQIWGPSEYVPQEPMHGPPSPVPPAVHVDCAGDRTRRATPGQWIIRLELGPDIQPVWLVEDEIPRQPGWPVLHSS